MRKEKRAVDGRRRLHRIEQAKRRKNHDPRIRFKRSIRSIRNSISVNMIQLTFASSQFHRYVGTPFVLEFISHAIYIRNIDEFIEVATRSIYSP